MLRGLFVFGILTFAATRVVKGPFYALLLYLWIAYFRPETWMWDPGLYLALNLSWITGLVLVGSSLLGAVRWRFDSRTLILLLFVLQDAISTFTSQYFDYASFFWRDFIRFAIITYLISVLVDDRRKLRLTIFVIAMSLGLEAAKQGWAQLLLNPGAKNGNAITVLGDENETAVGLFMLVPLLTALATTASRRWERWLHRFLSGGIIYRAIITYSRGGFLTAIALGTVSFARSKRKVQTLVVLAVLAVMIVPVLPQTFWDRMSTITVSADQRNEVSEGRLYFWNVAMEMAADHPLLGVGHNAYLAAFHTYDRTAGEFGENRAAHSSWFAVLADLGYPGLLLLVANIALCFVGCERVRRMARDRPDMAELGTFAVAMESAMIAFVVGATFVNLQYTEILWHLLGLSAALNAIALRESARIPDAVPASAPTVRGLAFAGGSPRPLTALSVKR